MINPSDLKLDTLPWRTLDMNINKQNTFGDEIVNLLNFLPDENLLSKTRSTDDLKEEYKRLRIQNQYFSLLLRNGLQGDVDNILECAKKILRKDLVDIYTAKANMFLSFFKLIQTSWTYIKKEFEISPKNSRVLFLTVLQEICNNQFRERCEDCYYTKHNCEDYLRIETKFLMKNITLKGTPTVIRQDETSISALDKIASKQKAIKNEWYNAIFNLAEFYSKSDELVNDAFRNHLKDELKLKDSVYRIYIKDRKGNKELERLIYSNQIRVF